MRRSAARNRHGDPLIDDERLVLEAQMGDAEARRRLVEDCLPSIAAVARLYRGAPVERRELIQSGVLGMLRALKRFDPAMERPFWAYAGWWVRQAMQELVSELGRPVVLSDRALRQLARISEQRREYLQAHGLEPDSRRIAQATGLSRERVESLLVVERRARGLDERVTGDDGGRFTFGDRLSDPRAEDAFEDVLQRRLGLAELRRLLENLDDRERAIVRGRYGLDGREQTLRELGCRFGVSAERVRQIENHALGKLRAATCSAGPHRAADDRRVRRSGLRARG